MKRAKYAVSLAIIVLLAITVPILAAARGAKEKEKVNEMQVITLWQIDGFEGGKGSRKQYLNNLAEKCFKNKNIYFRVTALDARAARENIKNGPLPDAISYPAGFYGIEEYVNKKYFSYVNWCYGCYCLITPDGSADFKEANCSNTVINTGRDNLWEVAATLCALNGSAAEEPVNAYLKLIGGNYKFLLGTQRDLFRFKARNLNVKVMPITQFNDLYQCFSILTKDKDKCESCFKFANYLKEQKNYDGIGLMKNGGDTQSEELSGLNAVEYQTVLNYPCSQQFVDSLKKAAGEGDANKIKYLLK